MNALCDIETGTRSGRRLVDAFYAKVNCDELLAPIYDDGRRLIGRRSRQCPAGDPLFGSGNSRGAPFPKHAVLPVQQAHFERWLTLFAETVDENFTKQRKSEEAKSRAVYMPIRSRITWVC